MMGAIRPAYRPSNPLVMDNYESTKRGLMITH